MRPSASRRFRKKPFLARTNGAIHRPRGQAARSHGHRAVFGNGEKSDAPAFRLPRESEYAFGFFSHKLFHPRVQTNEQGVTEYGRCATLLSRSVNADYSCASARTPRYRASSCRTTAGLEKRFMKSLRISFSR